MQKFIPFKYTPDDKEYLATTGPLPAKCKFIGIYGYNPISGKYDEAGVLVELFEPNLPEDEDSCK